MCYQIRSRFTSPTRQHELDPSDQEPFCLRSSIQIMKREQIIQIVQIVFPKRAPTFPAWGPQGVGKYDVYL